MPAREHRRRREGTEAGGGRGVGLAQRDPRGNGRQAVATCWRSSIPPTTKSCCVCSESRSNARGPTISKPTLDVEIARLAVREFQEGTIAETIQDFEGKIFLARSDLERAVDRLNWSRRMNEKGYVPAAVVTSDEFKKQQAAVALAQQEAAYALFKKYTAPKTLRVLEGAVQGAESMLEYQDLRLRSAARPAGLARKTSRELHDPRASRRLCHLRQ